MEPLTVTSTISQEAVIMIVIGAILGLLQAAVFFLAKQMMGGISASIRQLQAADEKLYTRIDEKFTEVTHRVAHIEQNFVPRTEISQGNRDMRQDLVTMKGEMLESNRDTRNEIMNALGRIDRQKVDKPPPPSA